MRKIRRKLLGLLIIITIMSLFAIGCKKTDIENSKEEPEKKDVSTNIGGSKNKELVDRGENIADNLVELIGIEGAAAIIYENQAIVAVEIADNVELNEELINMIKETTIKADGQIKDVKLIADDKTFDIIDNIAQSLIKGDSVNNYNTEINKIVKRAR